MPPPIFTPLLALTALLAPLTAAAGQPNPHELGWLCFSVEDTAISQIAAFNRDAPTLSLQVSKRRLFIDPTGPGSAGRVCAPTVVRLGDDPLPPETLVFEQTVRAGSTTRSASAEIIITPESPAKSEVSLTITGSPDQWTDRDGTLTFQARSPITFPARVAVSLPGDGDGPPAPDVFQQMPPTLRFSEECEPGSLEDTIVVNLGVQDPQTHRISPRGTEPYRLEAGTRVVRCPGLASDARATALARPPEPGSSSNLPTWYVAPGDVTLRPISLAAPKDGSPPLRYLASNPLGGYHVCRQPVWTTSTLELIDLAAAWELTADGTWRQLPAAPPLPVPAGNDAYLLDYRDGWALISTRLPGERTPRIVAVTAHTVALPSGPQGDGTTSGEALAMEGGLCPVARGQWRALKANSQSFRVSQDTPGAELSALWAELPMGTRVLQLCQDGAAEAPSAACQPVRVGGAQTREDDRFVLVRYAGTYLAIRENDLRDQSTGTFALRASRPLFAHDDISRDTEHGWSFGLGPGARVSFARVKNHAWALSAQIEQLRSEGWGFQGKFAVGGDGFGTFLTLGAGASVLVYRFSEAPLELRIGTTGELDLRTSTGGGLNFLATGKAQLRWVNDYAPLTFELGLQLGYGGTFGAQGRGGFLIGMPINLLIELVKF